MELPLTDVDGICVRCHEFLDLGVMLSVGLNNCQNVTDVESEVISSECR